jgi:hypothetical protein
MGYEARQRLNLTVSQEGEPARILPPSASMDTRQGTRLRKSQSPLLALASRASGLSQQSNPPVSRAHSTDTRRLQSASIQLNPSRSNQEQETEKLKAALKQAQSARSSLKAEVHQLETSLEQSLTNQSSLKRDYKKRLARAASTESSLREEIEKLTASLTRSTSNAASLKQDVKTQRSSLARAASTEASLRQEIEKLTASLTRSTSSEGSLKREVKNQRSSLEQAAATELSLKRKIDELKESRTQSRSTISQLKEDNKVLKTTLAHALTSERDMRTSARETREELETVETSLRVVIDALRLELEIKSGGNKGGKAASRVQQTIQEKVRTVEDAIALKQPHELPEGSSDIHILLDDLALQSLAIDGPNPMPHSTSDAFGSRLLPEFNALERATKGLQQAVNSEVRNAYTGKCLSTRCLVPQRTPNVARNLRLLVVLWESSGVEELLSSVTSILSDATTMKGDEDCAICTDPLLPGRKIVVEGCGHTTCKGCLREYIGARLGERVWPVRCPICMAEGGPGRKLQGKTVLPLAPVIT